MANLQASIDQRVPPPATRRILVAFVTLLLLVPCVRFFALQGMVLPVRIAGGSMADALYGPHLSVRCADCGFTFCCGVEYVPESQMAVCPNCGFARNRLDTIRPTAGKRVVIDRWSRWMHDIQPWQAVAFATPLDPDRLTVKRIVAGDGRIALRDGDLFVNGAIQQKSLQQLRQLQLLVHDDRFRPRQTAGLPDRWRGRQPDSRWQVSSTGYLCDASQRATGPARDWLEYTQWVCWPDSSPGAPRTRPTGILDHYGYNQNVSRSGLNQVSDLMLLCELTLDGTGVVTLRIDNATDCFALELSYPGPDCRLRHNGVWVWQSTRPLRRQPWNVEFAVCDHRVLAALNGVTFLQYGYQPTSKPRSVVASPLAVSAAGARVQFDAPRIYRDIYYLGPAGERRWHSPHPVAPQRWFVLGDNVPVSWDSRRAGPIEDAAMIGPVYPLAD